MRMRHGFVIQLKQLPILKPIFLKGEVIKLMQTRYFYVLMYKWIVQKNMSFKMNKVQIKFHLIGRSDEVIVHEQPSFFGNA